MTLNVLQKREIHKALVSDISLEQAKNKEDIILAIKQFVNNILNIKRNPNFLTAKIILQPQVFITAPVNNIIELRKEIIEYIDQVINEVINKLDIHINEIGWEKNGVTQVIESLNIFNKKLTRKIESLEEQKSYREEIAIRLVSKQKWQKIVPEIKELILHNISNFETLIFDCNFPIRYFYALENKDKLHLLLLKAYKVKILINKCGVSPAFLIERHSKEEMRFLIDHSFDVTLLIDCGIEFEYIFNKSEKEYVNYLISKSIAIETLLKDCKISKDFIFNFKNKEIVEFLVLNINKVKQFIRECDGNPECFIKNIDSICMKPLNDKVLNMLWYEGEMDFEITQKTKIQ
ncbi:MAG: hypothetical protein J0H68_04850 [Sphingobacteriia bacterium]|nr:hypothetical protein [Sphingobacteriia bacterium]